MLAFNCGVVNLLGTVGVGVLATVCTSQIATNVFELMAKLTFKPCKDVSTNAAMVVVFTDEANIGYCVLRAILAHATSTMNILLGAAFLESWKSDFILQAYSLQSGITTDT